MGTSSAPLSESRLYLAKTDMLDRAAQRYIVSEENAAPSRLLHLVSASLDRVLCYYDLVNTSLAIATQRRELCCW